MGGFFGGGGGGGGGGSSFPAPFDDAVFLWSPETSGQSRDLVTGGYSSEILTEGTTVTVDSDNGRSYNGAVGSRFGSPLGNFDPTIQEATGMIYASLPSANQTLYAMALAESGVSNQWLWLRVSNQGNTEISFRLAAQESGNNYIVPGSPTAISDTNKHCYMWRWSHNGSGEALLEVFVDDNTLDASDTGTPDRDQGFDRVTIGRTEDSSTNDSNGGNVYGAALWPRALTDGEISTVMSNPLAYIS